MSMRSWLWSAAVGAVLVGVGPVRSQVGRIKPTASPQVEVVQGKGSFAKKLAAAQIPAPGKGWKLTLDREKRLQVMIPDKWKVDQAPENELSLMAVPPGSEKQAKAAFIAYVRPPADDEPVEVDEDLATTYVYNEAAKPEFKKVDFTPTDSGLVILRDQRYALAGGTMKENLSKKKGSAQIRKVELLFFSEDRVTSIQFMAAANEFEKYEDEVARIFASCQNINLKPAQ